MSDRSPKPPSAALCVRLAGPACAPSLSRIHAEAFESGWDADSLQRMAAHEGARLFVATVADEVEPAGFVLTWRVAEEAEILTFAVIPRRRRRGVAQALLACACGQAREDGAARMFIEVAASNEAALGLYRKAGFSADGRRRGYYHRAGAEAGDALLMSLSLADGARQVDPAECAVYNAP